MPERETVNNLHSIWDSVIYSYIGYETLPLTDERWSWITETVDKLHSDHPVDIDKEEFKHYCLPLPKQCTWFFESWALESAQFAIENVYDGFTENEEPS